MTRKIAIFLNKAMNSDRPFIAGIFLLTLLMAWPLISNSLIRAFDLQSAFMRSVSMNQAWREGDLIPRWMPHIISGYGYSMSNFYAPLFSYIAAVAMFFLPAFLAFNFSIILVLFASGVAMYFFAREIWGRDGAFLSAAAYLFAPYHILDVYVRGTPAELTAFVFFPLILWALLRISRSLCLKDVVLGILAMTGLLLSHNISAFLFLPLAFFYTVVLFFTGTNGVKEKLYSVLASAVVFISGFLLSAYFWLPAMMEKKFVQIERLTVGQYDYRHNFSTLPQLIYSPWGYGTWGGGMSIMVGIVHLCFVMALFLFFKKVTVSVKDARRQIIFFSFVLVVAAFFTVKESAPLWKVIPLLYFTEFPWRFLIIMTLAVSIMAGGIIFCVSENFRKKFLGMALIAIVGSNIFFCHSFGTEPVKFSSPVEYLQSLLPMDNMEYLSKWVKIVSVNPPPQKLQVLSGTGAVEDKGGRPLDRLFSVDAKTPVVLVFHSYYFPGWEAAVDGRPVDIKMDNPFGLIIFQAPAGSHDVRIFFTTTPVRTLAQSVSLVTLILFAMVFCFRKNVTAWLKKF
ncbi:MAG: hypothetical protein HQL16_04155 [Candidatus Omnitrophica bacterium]|nr:hypothetical protein [Candidatus Omnitrophota bacterium]